MIDIAFVNETDKDLQVYEEIIEKVFLEASRVENIDKYYEVSVVFVSKERIREINKEYREIDKVTDVISFALLEDSEEDEMLKNDENITTLGDIFICVDKALEQAESFGHSFEREIAFLACHGFLHLIGYDHLTTEEETEMFSLQDQILNQLQIKRE